MASEGNFFRKFIVGLAELVTPKQAAPNADKEDLDVTHPLNNSAAYFALVVGDGTADGGAPMKTTGMTIRDFVMRSAQRKTRLWTGAVDVAIGDEVYTAAARFFKAKRAISSVDNSVQPGGLDDAWKTNWIELGGGGGGGGNNGGSSAVLFSGVVNPTAALPADAPVGAAYVNTATRTLWFKIAAADPGAWEEISIDSTELVVPVYRYVRVTAHGDTIPTLTGGDPGASYRTGMFVTEPTADFGTVLTAFPRTADTASYDYFEYRAIYDSEAAFSGNWDYIGKVDEANPPAQSAGLTRDEVLALLQHADAAAAEGKQGTVTFPTIRSVIASGLAVADSALRAAGLKVFTDYLPVPSGGMGLRWKADGTGLENYEITTDFVLRVVRFVRVAHDAAAPTLTGGVPGDNWRGGAFATPPVAGNGGTLLGSWPATPDYATYDYYQFSAEVDTASAAAIVWANNGKRDNANPPDLTGGLSEQEVLDLLASDAARALEARRGTVTLAEIRALFDPVTIPIVGAGTDTPRLDDGAMPMALPLPEGVVAGDLKGFLNGVYMVGVDSVTLDPLDVETLPTEKPASGSGNWLNADNKRPAWRVWKDGDAIKVDAISDDLDTADYFTSLTIQVQRVALFKLGLMGLEEALAAKEAAETAQETADAKAPKTTYEFLISPAPEAPSAPAANIFIPFTDPIAPQGPLDERVPVTFTFRTADGDVEVETSAYTLRASSEAAPVVLANPDDDTKEFIIWFISETSLGWDYRNADDSAIVGHGVLFVQVEFIARRTLDATNIPSDLSRGASDNGSLVNTKLLNRALAMFPSVSHLGQQLQDIMSAIKILSRGGVSQFLSHLSLGADADTVTVAPGFARLADLRDLAMSVAASAMNFIQAGSGVAWDATTKILSGLGAADGHLFGLHIKAIQAGTVMQLRKADGSLMNLITMKADGSVHFNSYHDEAFEDDEHTIHVATDWSPTDFSGSTFAEAELPVIGDHWPGSETAGSTDYNGASFSPFIVRLLERGVVAQGARVQLPALDPTQQAAIHFEAEAVWVDTDVRLVSAGAEAVVQYRYARRTTSPEVFARVYVQIRLHVIRGSVTGRVDDLHLNSTVNYTTHTHVAAGVTEAPALLTAAADSEFVFYSAAPLPAAPRAPTIAVYVNPQGGESSFNDFYPERGSFDYDQVVLNDDIVSEIRHAAHTQYISHAELYAYARLRTSKWVYAIGRLVAGTARVMLSGIGMGFSEGAEGEGGKAFLVEGEGGGGGGGAPLTNGAPDYAHLGTPNMESGTFTTGADGGTVGGTPGVSVADSKILFGADHKAESAVKFLNDKVTYPTTNLPPGAVYDATTGELTLPGSADENSHWIVCASVRVRANSAGGGGGDRVWVRGSIFHGDNERHSNQTYIRYSDLDGDANQAGANADTLPYTNEARLSVTGSVVADGVRKTKIQISAFSQNLAQLNGADDPNANIAILGAHVHAYKITKAEGSVVGGEGAQLSDVLNVPANESLSGLDGAYDVDLSGAVFLTGMFNTQVGRTTLATRDSSGVWVIASTVLISAVSDTGFTVLGSIDRKIRAYPA